MTITSDQRLHGLHVFAVVNAARALVARMAAEGGSERVEANALRTELAKIAHDVDLLSAFEQQCAARGVRLQLDAEEIATLVEHTTPEREETGDVRDAKNMSAEKVANLFDAGALTQPDDDTKDVELSPDPSLEAFDV